MKDQEAEFYNQLAELSESLEFKVADFERFVDTVRETASRHLHTLVLVNADLRGVCHRGLRLDGAIGQGEICNSLKSEKFSKSFLSHIGKNKIKF